MCSLIAYEKHGIINEVLDTERLMEGQYWQGWMKRDNEDEVRKMIAHTLDPISKKIMKTSGEKIVSTMPRQMIDWMRSTGLYY